jgi:dolichol-phosphate mannosyltransferase
MRLTVVIPTYNEAENLEKLVSALFRLPIPELSLLVVDDHSPDGTGDLADLLARQHPGYFSVLHRQGKQGLGTAYISGFRSALNSGAEAIAQMDADFSHPPELLVDLLEMLNCCDVVMGSRYVPGGAVDDCWPAWRKGLSAFGNIYARSILKLPVRDVTGGYRLWHRRTLLNMPLERVRSNGYGFQIEMAYIACRLGYNFREVPFYFADRRWGKSAIRVWQMLFEYRNLHPVSS